MGAPLPKSVQWLMYAGSLILAAAALILLVYVGYEAFRQPRDFSFYVWLAILLVLIAFTIFLIGAIITAVKIGSEAKRRFAGYQLVTFLILVLSLLAFALHHRESEGPRITAPQKATQDNKSGDEDRTQQETVQPHPAMDTSRNVAEMAAIMVLFLLAELAAFIAHDVTETKNTLEDVKDETKTAATTISRDVKDLNETTASINQLRLVTNVASLHPDVLHETFALLSGWANRVPAPAVSSEQTASVSDRCWQILFKEYLKEELHDFVPPKTPSPRASQRIPASVIPIDQTDIMTLNAEDRKGIQDTNLEDVSFIATTIGFYAHLLANLVDGLSKMADDLSKNLPQNQKKKKLCMAIVTNMLPAHCWDWPMPDKSWRSYDPIDAYRESMLDAVESKAQIDRVILVSDDNDPLLFDVSDFIADITTGAVGLIQKLRSDETPSKYLHDKLSDTTRGLLAQDTPTEQDTKELLIALANDLNRLLEDESLYDQNHFQQVTFSAETNKLLQTQPTGSDLIRRNRLLLEDTYPNELKRSLQKLGFYSPHEAHEGYFWRRLLLDYMLENWYILSPTDPKRSKLVCSPNFQQDQGQIGTNAFPLFPSPIQYGALREGCSVYPIVISDNQPSGFTLRRNDVWQAKKLCDEYDNLHGANGHCWRLPLNDASLNILNGRHDIMFIGIGPGSDKEEGLWDDDSCDWGICLMSSMNPVTETMFLTVISGKSVEWNYKWCRAKLNARMDWSGDKINRKCAEGAAHSPETTVPPDETIGPELNEENPSQ